MKKRSVIALLLAIVMLAMCCVACGDEKKDQATEAATTATQATAAPTEAPVSGTGIVGKWGYTIDYDSVMGSIMEETLAQLDDSQKGFYEEMFKAFEGVTASMIVEFGSDGTYVSYVDPASADATIEKLKTNLREHMPAMFAAMGLSADDLEEQLGAAGYTLDTYTDMLIDQMDTSSFTEASSEGVYRHDGDRLYTALQDDQIDENCYSVVAVTATTITITEIVGSDDGASGSFITQALLPMTLTRVG